VPTSDNSVSVVIPNWNRRRLLERLLKQLAAQSHPIHDVLVVDNGSSDGSAEAAEALGCRVLRLGSNRGFARAVNEGVRSATTEWVAILNNDVEIPAEWLGELMSALGKAPEAVYAAGKLYQKGSTTLDSTFDLVSKSGCAWRAGNGRADGPVWNDQRDAPMIALTAAVCRRDLFDRIGFLDEDFESYLEDVDFGIRCALSGEHGLYVPSAVGSHEGSATLGVWHRDTVRRISRNQVLLVAKHFPRNWVLRYGWPVLVGQLLWGMVAARHGAAISYFRGKLDGIRLWHEVRRKTTDHQRFEKFVVQSEREIRELQQKTGFDHYWRVYFALT
jgi:GT2 family glycosyltransferase